jgi:hypothetical protein
MGNRHEISIRSVVGGQSNPNDGPNTQIKYRKYRRAANQIKSNGAPAKKKQTKSKSNTGQDKPKWDQMAARGEPRHLA